MRRRGDISHSADTQPRGAKWSRDRTYSETFCFGGKRFDELLTELGARRVGEVFRHDASAGTMPEELAADWAIGWIESVKSGRALPA